MSKTRKWIRQLAHGIQEMTGTAEYDVTFRELDKVGEGLLECCYSQPRYDDATIDYASELKPTFEHRHVITHEVIHLTQMHTKMAVQTIIRMLSEEQRELAEKIWADGMEPDTHRLARALLKTYDELVELREYRKNAEQPKSVDVQQEASQ